MKVKLTLRLDETLVKVAKEQAANRGKSVSQLFAEIVSSLRESAPVTAPPPLTSSLVGILDEKEFSEAAYAEHLRKKHS